MKSPQFPLFAVSLVKWTVFDSQQGHVTTIEYEHLDYMAKVAVLLAINGHDVRVTNDEHEELCYVIEYQRYCTLAAKSTEETNNG